MFYFDFIKLALGFLAFSIISIGCRGQSPSKKMGKLDFVTDLEKVEQEFNSYYRMGRRIHWSSINTGENSRINYAFIEIWDSTRVFLENNRISARVPLTAKVSYVEWKTAFGKRYSRDTILTGVEIALKLETEPKLNQEGALNAVTQIQVDIKNQADFLKHVAGIQLFGKAGKLATTFENIILRNSKTRN